MGTHGADVRGSGGPRPPAVQSSEPRPSLPWSPAPLILESLLSTPRPLPQGLDSSRPTRHPMSLSALALPAQASPAPKAASPREPWCLVLTSLGGRGAGPSSLQGFGSPATASCLGLRECQSSSNGSLCDGGSAVCLSPPGRTASHRLSRDCSMGQYGPCPPLCLFNSSFLCLEHSGHCPKCHLQG